MHTRILSHLNGFRLITAALVLLSLLSGTVIDAAASGGVVGAVYTMTNSASGNAVQVYDRFADGSLRIAGTFATGGFGIGVGLGSQGAIVLSSDGPWLFAVNAGSSEISEFSVSGDALTLVDKVPSGGVDPISLAYFEGTLYVLNAGSGGNIAGFSVSSGGLLSFIPGSVRLLSNQGLGAAPSPEEIAFTPDGASLVVSEKGSGMIDTYNVVNGLASGPVVNNSAGPAPYGFGFTPAGVLVISEAAHSAVSTYNVTGAGLSVISASLPDTQAAACWLVVSQNGRFAYAANAASGTISGYRVSANGQLALLTPNGITGVTGSGSHPIDETFSVDGRFLYVLASGTNKVNAFSANPDGSLNFIASYSSPAGASGLASH